MLPKKLVFVDVETTGGSLTSDRIIEIAIIRVEDGKVVKTFQSLINPNKYLPPEIEVLTGITPLELDSAPSFYQLHDEIFEILDDAVMVAHNVRFDYSFIKNEFKRVNLDFSPKHFCTVKLSRTLFPQFRHHNLDSIIERHNIKVSKRHRAFEDTNAIWEFFQQVLKAAEGKKKLPIQIKEEIGLEFNTEYLSKLIKIGMKRPTVPIKINQKELDNLPEKPGVYIFYGEAGMPLYIGKSINIRKRVLSHFSADHLSSTEMKIAQQVESIETKVCSGELGALLLESDLVKKMQPFYNRKLRYSSQLVVLKLQQVGEYYAVNFEDADNIDVNDLSNILGIFRNKKKAKDYLVRVCKEFNLCDKLLGIEKTPTACFSYRLGSCLGACVKKENFATFNLRFLTAFRDLKLQSWPYSTPILISEKEFLKEGAEGFLIDRWCYLGKLKYEDDVENISLVKDIKFDLDIYKILSRYLRENKNSKNIKPIQLEDFKQLGNYF